MRLGMDVRAALWYRASGIGTYSYQMWHNLQTFSGIKYQLVPLGEKLEKIGPVSSPLRLKKIDFWQALYNGSDYVIEDLDLYHNPQNGFGLPVLHPAIPLVVTIHDLIPYILPQTCSRVYLRLFLEHLPRIVEHARLIIAVSNNTKEDIVRTFRVKTNKIRVIYEAAEPVYKPLTPEERKAEIIHKYGLKENYFLHVGGFSRRKNALAVIRAFARLSKKLPDWQLAIVGRPGGGCFNQCIKLIEYFNLRGRVILTGLVPVDDMPHLYCHARALVYPSLYEGFGLPVLEAMACRIPCIVGNTSSMPEIVGESAILINPYELPEIEEAMWIIANDDILAETLRMKGEARVKNYSWQKAARETLQAYEDVL